MINKIKIRLSILILSLVAIISIMTISISGEVKKISNASQDYKDKLIRFHVIANSDSDEDQNLKLKVRDAVINYLQPKLLESESIEESELIIKREYSELEKISKNIIPKVTVLLLIFCTINHLSYNYCTKFFNICPFIFQKILHKYN